MDYATLPYAKLDEVLNTTILTIDARLNNIERAMMNPAITTEPLFRNMKKSVNNLYERLKNINNEFNPELMVPAPVASPFFIHKDVGTPMSAEKERMVEDMVGPGMELFRTPVKAAVVNPRTPVYSPAPYTPGRSRVKNTRRRKNGNVIRSGLKNKKKQ